MKNFNFNGMPLTEQQQFSININVRNYVNVLVSNIIQYYLPSQSHKTESKESKNLFKLPLSRLAKFLYSLMVRPDSRLPKNLLK